MPTVSTGGTPLTAISPSSASAPRPATAGDRSFAVVLAPIAAELGKGGNQSPQPGTLPGQDGPPGGEALPAGQSTVAVQGVAGTVADDATANPQVASNLNKLAEATD